VNFNLENETQSQLQIMLEHGINVPINHSEITHQCYHWKNRKSKKLVPTVKVNNISGENKWECEFCGDIFPIQLIPRKEVKETCEALLNQINQTKFFSVKLQQEIGVDKETLSSLRELIPKFLQIHNDVYQVMNNIKKFNETLEAEKDQDSDKSSI
jgi:hypothetical protein